MRQNQIILENNYKFNDFNNIFNIEIDFLLPIMILLTQIVPKKTFHQYDKSEE